MATHLNAFHVFGPDPPEVKNSDLTRPDHWMHPAHLHLCCQKWPRSRM